MKTFLKFAVSMTVSVLMSPTVFASESACANTTCVSQKNQAMAAVFNFLFNEDSCVNDTQWVQSVTKTSDTTFVGVCGTANKSVKLNLKVSPQPQGEGGEGDYLVEIVN